MVTRNIREKSLLGKVKDNTLHPLDTMSVRLKRVRSNRMRAKYQGYIDQLPPANTSTQPRVEIHMLCGAGQWDMGIWSSWSILRFLDNASLVVHSDGTLTRSMMDCWSRVVEGTVFVDRAEADQRVMDETADAYPHLYAWRCGYWSAPQAVDYSFFGSTDLILSMDTDVLCFRRPEALQSLLLRRDADLYHNYALNGRSKYMASSETMTRCLEEPIPRAVNSGFALFRRFDGTTWQRLDEKIRRLREDPEVVFGKTLQANTMYALAYPRRDVAPLPEAYDIVDGPTPANQVVRHYIGKRSIRYRYFCSGLSRLWWQAAESLGGIGLSAMAG